MDAPIDTFWQTVKGKYKAKILIYLNDKTLRYTQIQRKFSDASERILIKQLKELEGAGLIAKTITGTKPPLRSEYRLTEHGKTLCPILKLMWQWGERHRAAGPPPPNVSSFSIGPHSAALPKA